MTISPYIGLSIFWPLVEIYSSHDELTSDCTKMEKLSEYYPDWTGTSTSCYSRLQVAKVFSIRNPSAAELVTSRIINQFKFIVIVSIQGKPIYHNPPYP